MHLLQNRERPLITDVFLSSHSIVPSGDDDIYSLSALGVMRVAVDTACTACLSQIVCRLDICISLKDETYVHHILKLSKLGIPPERELSLNIVFFEMFAFIQSIISESREI